MTITAKDVEQISRLLDESSFDELHLEIDGMTLNLKRRGAPASAAASAAAAPATCGESPATPAAMTPRTASAVGPRAESAVAGTGASEALRDVSAPLLGTFYRAPKPGAPAFVDVGTVVAEDTVIGIIEVMKLMNTVRAGVSGEVIEILARDGELVEYGETLLRVRAAGAA